MPARPFIAFFPKPPTPKDEVLLKGKLQDNAKTFSVNFCLNPPPTYPENETPPYIAYHFKTIFNCDESSVVHNHKNVNWNTEQFDDNTWAPDGPGQEFVLRFILNEDSIIVYTGDYPSSIFEYEFKLQYDISTITNIQVWDDVERVDELVFRYKN